MVVRAVANAPVDMGVEEPDETVTNRLVDRRDPRVLALDEEDESITMGDACVEAPVGAKGRAEAGATLAATVTGVGGGAGGTTGVRGGRLKQQRSPCLFTCAV